MSGIMNPRPEPAELVDALEKLLVEAALDDHPLAHDLAALVVHAKAAPVLQPHHRPRAGGWR